MMLVTALGVCLFMTVNLSYAQEHEQLICEKLLEYKDGTVIRATGKGDRGPQGPPGPRAVVDYNRINSFINETVARIVARELRDIRGNCKFSGKKVTYKGKCFFAIRPGSFINYKKAEELCKAEGATPANFYSKEQYDRIIEYFYSLPRSTGSPYYTFVWIGMKVAPRSTTVTNYDGSPAQFVKWRRGDPGTGTARQITLDVMDRAQPLYRTGMLRAPWNAGKFGVLCEI